MAHTYDTKAQWLDQTGDPFSQSLTLGGTSTLLVVSIATERGGGTSPRAGGAPTYNSVSLTQAGTTNNGSSELDLELWHLVSPATGANTLVIPNTGGETLHIVASSYISGTGTSQFDTTAQTTGESTSASQAVTPSADGAVIVSTCADDDKDAMTGNQTDLYQTDYGQRASGDMYHLQATAGASTHTYTLASSDLWGITVAAFIEVTSGTTTPKTVTGSITASGALIKQTLYNVIGSITSTGALLKDIFVTKAGSITGTGAIAKLITLGAAFAGSITATGALSAVKTFFRTLTGSITASSVVVRGVQKVFTGSVTTSGTLLKETALLFSGSITPAGTIAKFITLGTALAGSIAATGVLGTILLFTQAVAGSVTITGALVKLIGKSVVGAITTSGTIVKTILKALVGSITSSSSSLLRAISVVRTGTITASATLLEALTALQSAASSITPSGLLSAIKSGTVEGVVYLRKKFMKYLGRR